MALPLGELSSKARLRGISRKENSMEKNSAVIWGDCAIPESVKETLRGG